MPSRRQRTTPLLLVSFVRAIFARVLRRIGIGRMTMTDDKAFWMSQLAEARQKLERLPTTDRIRTAMPERFFEDLEQYIDELEDPRYWPPFFGFLGIASDDQLAALESDLDLVLQTCEPKSEKALTQFVRAKTGDSRIWYGGLFDMWARATLIRERRTLEFDVPLANGRDTDIRLQLGDRRVRLENTVITQDDESREVWDRFLDDKKVDPDKTLMRPGSYDPPDAKGPSPYYNTLRLYAKVYDKLARKLDPSKSQCADDEPNVLLLSFAGPGVYPDTPGYGWALDELFNTRGAGRIVKGPHLHDISLDAWIEFTLADLCQKKRITVDEYDERMRQFGDIAAAPRRLGGVMLFDGFTLATARINYNARDECSLTHAEMAELERLLGDPPEYSH